jgi:predicted aspartyl protease
MGLVYRNVRFGAESGAAWVEVRALIDTGATHCQVPVAIAQQLQGRLFQRTRVLLADGTIQERDIVYLQVQLDETLPPVLTTVIVGGDNAPVLVVAVAMEQLGVGIDPTTQKLVSELPVLLATAHWQTR